MTTYDHSYSSKQRGVDRRFAAFVARDEANASRIRLMVEAELKASSSDVLGLMKSRVAEPRKNGGGRAHGPLFGGIPQFEVPASRGGKVVSAEGKVTIHFAHSPISKTADKPGAEPRKTLPEHNLYIERDDAVARIETGLFCLELTKDAVRDGLGDFGVQPSVVNLTENHSEQEYSRQSRLATAARVALAILEPPLGYAVAEQPLDPQTGLCNLPDSSVVANRDALEVFLPRATDVDLGRIGATRSALRHARASDRQAADGGQNLKASPVSASSHDAYIARAEALAGLDGAKVIFSNISSDADERRIVWEKIEKNERPALPDTVSIDFTRNYPFLVDLAQAADCPTELRAALENRDTAPVVVTHGRKLKYWISQQPGYDKGSCPIKVKVGRAGRVQLRIIGELPEELTLQQRTALLREFCNEFGRRNLPFVAAMHQPGPENDHRGWHFHIDYYDRPISRLGEDRWDFEYEPYRRPSGEMRKGRACRRNKNDEVRGRDWIPKLRKRLVDITNRHLEQAGFFGRYDDRSYEDMDIEKVPEEHLGSKDFPRERQGIVTAVGAANGERDWNYQIGLVAKDHEIGVANTEKQVSAWRDEFKLAGLRVGENDGLFALVDKWQTSQLDMLENRRMSAEVLCRFDRAQSRALMVTETCSKKMSLSRNGKLSQSAKVIEQWQKQRGEAQTHLDQLEAQWDDDLRMAAVWAAKAKDSESRAGALAVQLAMQLELVKGSQSPVSERHDDGATIPAAVSQPAPVRVREDQPMPPRPISIRLNVALERLRREPFRIKTIAERHSLDPADLRVLGINELDLAPPSVQARLGGIRSVSERQLGRLEGYAKSNPYLWISTGKTVCLRHDADPEMLEMEKRWTGDAQFQSEVMMIKNIADARDVNSQHSVGGETRVSRPTAQEKSAIVTPQLRTANNPAAAATSATMTREQPADTNRRIRAADNPTPEAQPATTVLEPQSLDPLIAAYNQIDPENVLARQSAAAAICRDDAASKSVELLAPEDRKAVRADADDFKRRVERNKAMAGGGQVPGIGITR